MKAISLLLPLGLLVVSGCASTGTDISLSALSGQGAVLPDPPNRSGQALPIHLPSVTFSPGSVVTKGEVSIGPGSVPAGSYVSVRVFVAPRTEPDDVLDLHLLHKLKSGEAPRVYASSWRKVASPSQVISWPLDIETAIPTEASVAYSVIGVYVGSGPDQAHVVVKNAGYDARTFLLVGGLQIEVSRLRAEFDVPADSQPESASAERSGAERDERTASPTSGTGQGQAQGTAASTDAGPAVPLVVPSVTFPVAGKARLEGKLKVDPKGIPVRSFLHLAAYQGQSMSASVQPISFEPISKSTVHPVGETVTAAACEAEMSGTEIVFTEGMTHLWTLFVTEVWITRAGADPILNSKVGRMITFDIANPDDSVSSTIYFAK